MMAVNEHGFLQVCSIFIFILCRFPDYIHNRLKELGKSYSLRIVLVQVDTVSLSE